MDRTHHGGDAPHSGTQFCFSRDPQGLGERAGLRITYPIPTELQDLMPVSRARKPAFILSSMRDEKRRYVG